MHRHTQNGLSLVEILVTVGIASFALLGLASMLMRGIQSNNSSFLRSIAVQQAYDIVDRMRANIQAVNDGSFNSVSFDASATCTPCTSSCTTAQLASNDICTWQQQNATLLPSGQGSISKTNSIYTVTVQWNDNRSGLVNQNATNTKNVTLKVEP
jgi:type IV pilus assembly protein PilV